MTDNMTDAEKIVYEWLKEDLGYLPREIEFRTNKTPDFVTSDGYGWEVKKLNYNNKTIQITENQFLKMDTEIEKTYIIIVDKNNSIINTIQANLISVGDSNYGNIQINWMKPATTVYVEDETWDILNKMKRRGESFDKVINRLIDMADFNFLHWQEIEILEELDELWKEQDYKDKYPTLFTLHNLLEANLDEIKTKRRG